MIASVLSHPLACLSNISAADDDDDDDDDDPCGLGGDPMSFCGMVGDWRSEIGDRLLLLPLSLRCIKS